MSKQVSTFPPIVVVAPHGTYSGITAGKEYRIVDFYEEWDFSTGWQFTIIDDYGLDRFCVEKGCLHIESNNWILKESEENNG